MLTSLILDLDGTLTTKDMLDWACGLADKQTEAEKLMAVPGFGIEMLVDRINLLSDLHIKKLQESLALTDYLRKGAVELVKMAKNQGLTVVICSGNVQPIVEYYKSLLGADYALGSPLRINHEGLIEGAKIEDFIFTENLKVNLVNKLFQGIGLNFETTVAIGDSSVDVNLFQQAAISISIGENKQAQEAANYQIKDDLSQILPIIQQHLH